MRHECPYCGYPVSKSWLFFGVPGGPQYICPNCHARLKMTYLRYLINFLVGGLGSGFLFLEGLKNGMGPKWFLVYLPLVLFIFAMAVWFTPGQYEVAHEGRKDRAQKKDK